MEKLLSPDNTAALLDVQTCTDIPIWNVRREALRRGCTIEKAVQKMCEALHLDNDADNEEDDEEDDENDGASAEELPRRGNDQPDFGKKVCQSACNCLGCVDDRLPPLRMTRPQMLPQTSLNATFLCVAAYEAAQLWRTMAVTKKATGQA
jgi:hypothetical protein